MPEAPDLQVLREYLEPRIQGEMIVDASVLRPLVVRNMVAMPLTDHLPDRCIERLERKGKLIILSLSGEYSVVISPMLTGETALVDPSKRVLKSTVLTMELSNGLQLRYTDVKRMGQIYYLSTDRISEITRVADQGPDVLDEPMKIPDFRSSLKQFRGEIKGVLTRGQLVAGIGNAYADEVLWDAGIYPFRKVSTLSVEEVERLHASVYRVPSDAVATLRSIFGTDHPRKERKFLNIHGKAGQACPTCGSTISSVKSRQRDTNFCRSCQPGTLFK